MSKRAKKEYLKEIRKRYLSSSKQDKQIILDEFCKICNYNRKYAIRLINKSNSSKKIKKRAGRHKKYNDPVIIDFLRTLWISSNLVCSKRLKVMIALWMPFYNKPISEIQKQQLLCISPATIDRTLLKIKSKYKKLGLSSTKPGSLIKKQIPIKTNQWDESRPGFLEADTVAHCGSSLAGSFIYSVNTTDIATGWIETRACWGKGQTGVFEALKSIKLALPFRILGFDSDNGGEFLNYYLLKFFRNHHIQFTRSREYQSNDNAHIEQKNWTHIRQYLGYQRFDNPLILPLLNNLYCNQWSLFFNFFVPSVKLISKIRIGSKTVKKHDPPKTPFQRLLLSKEIKPKTKKQLIDLFNSLNPFLLQRSIKEQIHYILNLI
ncbi:MAG: transposase [Ignavibacteriales bacterium]|nr:MAG: transposase [Ignavibacteriales bacterium]